MRQSMTGFASRQGRGQGQGWTWDLRGVNGKGLDVRFRLPDWIEGLESKVRDHVSSALSRGNVQISLRVHSEDGAEALRVDDAKLSAVLDAMKRVEAEAGERGLVLKPSTAAEVVALRGVLTADAPERSSKALLTELLADFELALSAFVEMRAKEGTALQEVISRQLDQIESLVAEAERGAADREAERAARLRAQLARVIDDFAGVDETRLAQELAQIAVKADITEEIDRLRAHVGAARDLLARDGPVGRKLDFLAQEFNREANTLCSKSGDAALTQTGLALKSAIDQMREQIQNVE